MRSSPIAALVLLLACGPGAQDADVDTELPDDTDMDPRPFDPDAAARAFPRFYKERVQRVLTAWNRFGIFGDASFATSIHRVDLERAGDTWVVVPGPKDNNPIGTSTFSVWAAWKVYGTPEAELTLLRMLQGLTALEQMPGVPGLTSREVLPGWTRTVDGVAGTQTRLRHGAPALPGIAPAVDITDEVIAAFYSGTHITYREDPQDYLLTHHAVTDLDGFVTAYAFPSLPDFLRVSDCCASWMHTPEGYPWAGAWWSNHNSRDNTPDLELGFAVGQLVLADASASERLRTAAAATVASGERVGALTRSSGSKVMTVDEFSPYGDLVPSGTIRPHGLSEGADLGSLAACPMVWLNEALTPDGLSLPVPARPYDGEVASILRAIGVDCPDEGPPTCTAIDTAYCGATWSTFGDLQLFGQPLLDVARNLETSVPGSGEQLFGAFQSDLLDVVEGLANVTMLSERAGDPAVAAEARASVRAMTDLVRTFADILYANNPAQRAQQRYDAALLDGIAGLDPIPEDLGALEIEEARAAAWEGLLTLPNTGPRALLTDEQIAERTAQALVDLGNHPSGRSDVIRDRYDDAFGDTPPVRRAGDAYEVRVTGGDWVAVPNPADIPFSNVDLLAALPLCVTSPSALDCTWAARGCAPADRDVSGLVDDADVTAQASYPVDVDGDGTIGPLDDAYVSAAVGCWYTP